MAYAPSAIEQLFAAIQKQIPQAVLGGIVGDVAHSFGYHLARNELPGTDYSVQLPPDRLGDGGAASALDITLPPDLMKTCTARLLAAAKAKDPRLAAVREFCGTTDGAVTHNYDLSNGHEGFGEWDDSHLWHIHLSFYRVHAETFPILAPVADVLAGTAPPTPPVEDEMAELIQYRNGGPVYVHQNRVVQRWVRNPGERDSLLAEFGQDKPHLTKHSRDYFGVLVGPDPEAKP